MVDVPEWNLYRNDIKKFGRKIGLAAAHLFDATNLRHKPWTIEKFTSFKHGNHRLKEEISSWHEDNEYITKYYMPMQEQKLMVEAYHVYIEQCI